MDDYKYHKDEGFLGKLKHEPNTTTTMIPSGLTPVLQSLDRTLNKEFKRQIRARYSRYMLEKDADAKTGKLSPPNRGQLGVRACGAVSQRK